MANFNRDDLAAIFEAARSMIGPPAATVHGVPVEHLTHQLCIDAVRQGGEYEFASVPIVFRTPAFDRECCMLLAWCFGYIPQSAQTEEFLIEVINDSARYDPAMLNNEKVVRDSLFTRKVIEASIARIGRIPAF
jgi:hypothetical protein